MSISRIDLEAIADKHGLLLLGVVGLAPGRDYDRFQKWLSQGRQAGMSYLERNSHCRRDPQNLLAGARSAIILALPYDQGDSWPMKDTDRSRVAQYARIRDYHKTFSQKGAKIATELLSRSEDLKSHVARVIVDSAPLLERALAARTEFGFIGKNTCYIHPHRGSFLLLGEILTSAPLPLDEKTEVNPPKKTALGGCGSCRSCQESCPTGALDTDYSIDSNKCLAYWTIENRGTIPEKYWPWLGKYFFGCDICQLVCPYNRPLRVKSKLPATSFPSLFQVATMTQQEYEKYFAGTALTRAKREGLRRNALIAMTVTQDPQLEQALAFAHDDASFVIGETLVQISSFLKNSLLKRKMDLLSETRKMSKMPRGGPVVARRGHFASLTQSQPKEPFCS